LRKTLTPLVILIAVVLLVLVNVSCDREAAEKRIFSDPVMKKALLDRMMADADMMRSMIDHSLSDQILSDTIMTRILSDEQLRARMITKEFEDSLAMDDIIFRIRNDKELRDEVCSRRRR
jgi:hypothetical protein